MSGGPHRGRANDGGKCSAEQDDVTVCFSFFRVLWKESDCKDNLNIVKIAYEKDKITHRISISHYFSDLVDFVFTLILDDFD
jgi:hypothetical protein